jgi:hypothetical protein
MYASLASLAITKYILPVQLVTIMGTEVHTARQNSAALAVALSGTFLILRTYITDWSPNVAQAQLYIVKRTIAMIVARRPRRVDG